MVRELNRTRVVLEVNEASEVEELRRGEKKRYLMFDDAFQPGERLVLYT